MVTKEVGQIIYLRAEMKNCFDISKYIKILNIFVKNQTI
jgi:hypothetical protein